MGWAYSLDLRERVFGAFDAGDMTDEQVAEVLQVGEATVHRWKRLRRETGADVETFVEQVLIRKLHPGGIVVLDNGEAQKPDKIHRLVEADGARLPFLPPYSPDLNPIELGWSKLKAALKHFGARTRDALDVAVRRGMDLIGADDARAWFTHCGHQAHGI
jgi:transposase